MSRIAALLLALCVALPLLADEPAGAARLQADFTAAIEAEFPEPPALTLYDALGRLRAKPDSALDFQAVRDGVDKVGDASLRPFLDGLITLNAAAEGNLPLYLRGVERVKGETDDPALLKTLDLAAATVVCPDCRGDLRCDHCRGTLKCGACEGRGYTVRRASSSSGLRGGDSRSLGGSSLRTSTSSRLRVKCEACGGTGRCPDCGGQPIVCRTCNSTGKVPDPKAALARVGELAGRVAEHLATTQADLLTAREQTRLLKADLQKARGLGDPQKTLDFLAGLPPERVKAAQWSHVVPIRLDLEAILEAREANDTAKVRAHAELRAAVKRAQALPDPLKGLAALIPLFERYADCDALPEAQTAFDGLLSDAQRDARQRQEDLADRIALIGSLSTPADVIAQADALFAEWPKVEVPAALRAYAKANRNTALTNLLEDDALDDLRTRLNAIRAKAQTTVQAEAEEGTAWWIWVAVGLGALIVLYVLLSLVQGIFAKRAEAERKAKQRAALESVRNTMAHRRK